MKNLSSRMIGKVWGGAAVLAVLGICVSVTYARQNDQILQENARRAKAMNQSVNHLVPDVVTRRAVGSLSAVDIESLQLYGMDMGSFNGGSTPPIIVTNTELTASFLEALRSATSPTLRLGNGVDTIELHLKRKKGAARAPLRFNFNPHFPALWYGTRFNVALDQLAAFQAEQVRQKVSNLTPKQLKSVQIGKSVTTRPNHLESLLKALQNVDAKAYAYTTQAKGRKMTNFETLRLTLKNGKMVDLRLFLSPYSPNSTVKPLWDFYNSRS